MVITKKVASLPLDTAVALVITNSHIQPPALEFALCMGEKQRTAKLKHGDVVSYDVGWLDRVSLNLRKHDRENLGIISKVKLDGAVKHIPVIDFLQGVSLDQACDVVNTLGQKTGFIIGTNGSVSFLGFDLLTASEWRTLMELCWREKAIGYDWATKQLQRGYSVLRLSGASGEPTPAVLAQRYLQHF